mgnify:CR=1 FL=1
MFTAIAILDAAIANLRPLDRDRTDAGLDRSFRAMTVHEAGPAVAEPLVLHRSEEGGRFRLDRLGKKTPGAIAQDCGHRIVDRIEMSEWGNSAIRRHGRIVPIGSSGRLDTRPDTPPFSDRHHPGSAIAPTPSGEAFKLQSAAIANGQNPP